jgi:hypothetical protein
MEARAPGRPNCRGGRAYRHSAVMTIPMDGQCVESQSRDLRLTRIDTLFDPQQSRQPRYLGSHSPGFVF